VNPEAFIAWREAENRLGRAIDDCAAALAAGDHEAVDQCAREILELNEQTARLLGQLPLVEGAA
jgi:hypothetical protein